MKFLEFIVESIYWIGIFFCPAAILTIAGFIVYCNYTNKLGFTIFVGLTVLGVALGIMFAEKIRRSMGCSVFWSRIYSSGSENDSSKK